VRRRGAPCLRCGRGGLPALVLQRRAALAATVSDIDRYLPIVVPVGVVAECGHALVRMGHVAAGDNPPGDLVAPTVMLLFGMFLLVTGMVAREEDRTAGHRE